MLKKLFGGNKNDFYLELKEESEGKPAETSKATTSNGTKAAAQAPAPEAKTEASAPAPEAKTEVKPAPEAKTEASAPAPEAKTEKKSKKVSIKERKKAEKAKAPAPAPAPAPVAKASPKLPAETAFASKYLIPTNTNGRRRPGANMNAFLDMARQVKTPKK